MTVFHYIDLIGGLGVFLFGMGFMNKNLTALAGDRLRSLLLRLTKTKPRAYLTGLGITIVNQSSSATTVLLAVVVSAGLMSFNQSLGVTLGAELGSTFLGQLVAFPSVTKVAPLFVALGLGTNLLGKTKRLRTLGQVVLGLGFLFLGMDMMSRSVIPLRSSPVFLGFMSTLSNPLLGVLAGLVFTMIVQSSGATTGLVIAMAIGGTITLDQAVPLNLGASIGTCTTAILGSLRLSRDARRSAWIHLVFQTIGVAVALVFLAIPWQGEGLYLAMARGMAALTGGADDLARQIAMAHTLMPLLGHLVIIPLLGPITAAFDRLFPPDPEPRVFGPRHIRPEAVSEPAVALELARREILDMAPLVRLMFLRAMEALQAPEAGEADTKARIKEVKDLDTKVDTLRRAVVQYLARVAQEGLSVRQGRAQVAWLAMATEMENLADVIERNILDRAKKLLTRELRFSADGNQELQDLARVILGNFDRLVDALERNDPAAAQALLDEAPACWDLQQGYRRAHFERLNQGRSESLDTTEIHMDLLNHYNRINRHIYHMAQNLLDLDPGQG